MTNRAPRDEEVELDLSALGVHDAAPARVERIRARCLAGLARQRLAAERKRMARERRERVSVWRSWLEPAIALGLSALYLLAAVGNTVALFR